MLLKFLLLYSTVYLLVQFLHPTKITPLPSFPSSSLGMHTRLRVKYAFPIRRGGMRVVMLKIDNILADNYKNVLKRLGFAMFGILLELFLID